APSRSTPLLREACQQAERLERACYSAIVVQSQFDGLWPRRQSWRWGECDSVSDFTFLDLFCGAGGLSRGLVDAGFNCTLAIDHHEAAVETHRLNFASPVERVDVTKVLEFPPVTVVVGGPPCQGFSSAGLRAVGDHRNTLVGWFAETIARI